MGKVSIHFYHYYYIYIYLTWFYSRIKQIVTFDKIAEYAVAARTNPTLFHASPDGKNNATVIKNTGSATREAFVTFGATESCNIFEGI